MGDDGRRRFAFDLLLFRFSLPASLFFLGLGVSFLRAENVAGFSSFRIVGPNRSRIHPGAPAFPSLPAPIPSSGGGVDFLPPLRRRPASRRKNGRDERRIEGIRLISQKVEEGKHEKSQPWGEKQSGSPREENEDKKDDSCFFFFGFYGTFKSNNSSF